MGVIFCGDAWTGLCWIRNGLAAAAAAGIGWRAPGGEMPGARAGGLTIAALAGVAEVIGAVEDVVVVVVDVLEVAVVFDVVVDVGDGNWNEI